MEIKQRKGKANFTCVRFQSIFLGFQYKPQDKYPKFGNGALIYRHYAREQPRLRNIYSKPLQ